MFELAFGGTPIMKNGVQYGTSNAQWGICDAKGKNILPCKYANEGISYFFHIGNYARVCIGGTTNIDRKVEGGKWGIIDKKGIFIISCQYDGIAGASEGVIPVNKGGIFKADEFYWGYECSGGKWGYVDLEGNTVIDFLYDTAEPFQDGAAQVSLNGQTMLIENPLQKGNANISGGLLDDVDINIPETNTKNEETFAFSSARYPDMRVAASVNQNLIDYFNDNLLHINWRFYVSASMSDDLKRAVYPALRSSISGKSETEAVEMLLNFVQTAFDYQTDGQQFGYERSFFADETFFYPYSDCEDRSILFAVLVRELMELEVVLLDYPEHLATAVRFSSAVSGDYLTIDKRTFTICDPTFIGARIGMAMDEFNQTKAKVIFID